MLNDEQKHSMVQTMMRDRSAWKTHEAVDDHALEGTSWYPHHWHSMVLDRQERAIPCGRQMER